MEEKLPEGWVWTTLDAVVIPERIIAHPRENSTLPFIGLEHVEAETMRLIGTGAAQELKSTALHFWPGDVLYGRLRPYLNKVLQPDFEGLCSGEFLVFHKLVNINPGYLQYFLNSWDFKEFASHQITGDRPRVDWDQLKIFDFPLPPLPEQRRIVAAVEQQFTRLDNAVASLQSARAKAKQYRASLLKAAVEGELTREWRAEHPAEETGAQLLKRILAERRARWEEEQLAKMREKGDLPKDDKWKQKYNESQGPNVEKLPELPEGWCWASVEQVGEVQLGRQRAPQYHTGMYMRPYLRVANVFEDHIDTSDILSMNFTPEEFEIYRLEYGDILLNEGQSLELLGRPAMYRNEVPGACFQNTLIRFRSYTGLLPEYALIIFRSYMRTQKFLRIGKNTTNIAHLGAGRFAILEFPLPPLAEQERIVAEVEARLSVIAQMEETIEASLKRAEYERQSILREAFAGRLVEQDAQDEPASVLLVRIREERKRREEAEKTVGASRKERRMTKKQRAGKGGLLYTTLDEAGGRLPPDELFKRAGLKADEQHEAVEAFYEELRTDVEDALVAETQADYAPVVLEALEPSTEVLARWQKEEAQAEEEQQVEEAPDMLGLWNMAEES